MRQDCITRTERKSVDELAALYHKLGIDAKGEFHREIGVWGAHPLAMFAAGAGFIILIWALR